MAKTRGASATLVQLYCRLRRFTFKQLQPQYLWIFGFVWSAIDLTADFLFAWFELYNSTSDAIDLNGLQLNSGETGTAISSATIIEAEDYLVLGNRSNSAVNGGISDVVQYNGANFLLYASDSITIANASGTTLDTVSYSTAAGFPQGQGASLMSTSLHGDTCPSSNLTPLPS